MFKKFLDKELIRIVDEVVGSFIGWELILLFNANPSLKITKNELSLRINREEKDLNQVINNFLQKGLILKESDFYLYQPSDDLKEYIDTFIDALNDRNKRLAIISQLLNK